MTGRVYVRNQSNKNYRNNIGSNRMSTGRQWDNIKSSSVASVRRKDRRCSFFSWRKLIVLAVIFVLVLLVGFGPLSGIMQSGSSVVEANHQLTDMRYKVVQIEEGDSLWSIAQDNMDPGFSDIHEYIREVRRCNQLDSDTITAGNYLMVPYYEDLYQVR